MAGAKANPQSIFHSWLNRRRNRQLEDPVTRRSSNNQCFLFPFGLYALVFFIGFLLLGGPAALVSSLCLVFLSLTDEHKHTLGFLSFMGSATTLFVLPYYFYFVTSS